MAETVEPGSIMSAEQLRMKLLEEKMREMDKEAKAREAKQKELEAFSHSFLHDHVSEEERAMINRLVMNAVSNGQFEAMIYSFPSALCTDGGRAINNGDENWPDTLQGKGRELFDRYMEVAKPQGYKLKAMIINFPDGIPGDVGLFLNWAPPVEF